MTRIFISLISVNLAEMHYSMMIVCYCDQEMTNVIVIPVDHILFTASSSTFFYQCLEASASSILYSIFFL